MATYVRSVTLSFDSILTHLFVVVCMVILSMERVHTNHTVHVYIFFENDGYTLFVSKKGM